MGSKIRSFFEREIKIEILINILLYSVIIIMPFIVVNVSFPKYMVGKQIYLYAVGLLLTLIIIYLRPKKFNKEEIVAFIFLFTIMIPTVFSPVREIALWGSPERGEGLIIFFIYIMLFFLSHRYLIVNEKLLNTILIAASIMSLYSLIQYYGNDPIQKWMLGYINNPYSIGLIGNRNFLSSYLCIFLFISMAIYIFYSKKKYLIYSSILFAGLICTFTRSGWLAFLIYSILGLFFIVKNKNRLKKALILFMIFSSIFTILNLSSNNEVSNRAIKTVYVDDISKELVVQDSGRIIISKIVLKAFLDNPFMGWGPDTLMYRLNDDYNELQNEYLNSHGGYIDKAHNEFLEYAVCNGVFNLLAYLVLIGLIIYKLIGEINNDISKVLLLTIIGYLVQSLFNISVIMVAPLYWILLGFSLQKSKSELLITNI